MESRGIEPGSMTNPARRTFAVSQIPGAAAAALALGDDHTCSHMASEAELLSGYECQDN
jgi:hypothetical protein